MKKKAIWTLVVVIVTLWTAARVAEGQESAANAVPVQRFVLNTGWNLITFQVLPENRGAADVFASVVATDGSGRSLFDPENPEGSPLQAAFALHAVQERTGQATRFRWQALSSARYTDPEDLPSGSPFPDLLQPSGEPFPSLVDGQLHDADGSLNEVRIGAGYLVLVSGIRPGARFEIGGTELAGVVPVRLEPGWNLVGFPFDVTVEDEPRLILDYS